MNLNISYLIESYKNNSLTPLKVIEDILQRREEFNDQKIWIRPLTLTEIQPYLDNIKDKNIDDMPLYGIPFAIKDNIDLAGIPTTAACPAFEKTPEKSAFVVQQLINAGAIPIGKTNMDQFATGLVGTRSPEPWGECKNSFNKEYISGGSSSGSAVSVALGLASFSLGTDTAGSGRVPASFNNLVGLKPSIGLLSMTGVLPACRSLDCVSIFALTTDDANKVLEQAAIYDAEDQYARKIPFDNNIRQYGFPEKSFSFAVPKPEQLAFFGNSSAQKLFEDSVKKMETLGGEKQEIDFSIFAQAAKLLYEGPWVAERYVAIEKLITEQPEALLPVINTIIGGAANKSAIDAFKAEYKMQVYRAKAKQILSMFDFLMTPTTGTIYTIDEVNADPIKLNSNLGFYTNFMNLLDCSCVAVPAGFIDNDLPWGISLVSTAMSDRKLLSYANMWQQDNKLMPGNLGLPLAATNADTISYSSTIPVIVCGAHMQGLALNWQLTERGGKFVEKTKSAKAYRMFVIEGTIKRPGMIRDDSAGSEIDIEIWQVPKSEFGSFVAAIPEPLGIGKVETEDGRWLPGFICEGYAIENTQEVTQLGGWRSYIEKTQ